MELPKISPEVKYHFDLNMKKYNEDKTQKANVICLHL